MGIQLRNTTQRAISEESIQSQCSQVIKGIDKENRLNEEMKNINQPNHQKGEQLYTLEWEIRCQARVLAAVLTCL